MQDRLRQANLVAVFVPAALLAGAWGFQLIGGLHPCEMCHWQRWPHYAALAVATAALFITPLRAVLVALAALLIATSGVIGVLHAGVEYHWWNGFTACTSTVKGSGDLKATLDAIMNAPVVRCDVAQWSLFGISMAGWNALLSFAGAIAILGSLLRRHG